MGVDRYFNKFALLVSLRCATSCGEGVQDYFVSQCHLSAVPRHRQERTQDADT